MEQVIKSVNQNIQSPNLIFRGALDVCLGITREPRSRGCEPLEKRFPDRSTDPYPDNNGEQN